jgi:cobalt/nickel transport protein
MKKRLRFLTILTVLGFLSPDARAHFQLIYTPEVNLQKAGEVPLKLIFWHPMDNGHVMEMAQPLEFYSSFKGEKTNLLPPLKSFIFTGLENQATGFDTSVHLKRNGDYALALVPSPYLEKSEDIYIQQITKIYLNKGGIPTDWNKPIGLKTEILPLNKPYGAMVGSTFSGIVLSMGKPVAGIEIEIEHLSAEPDMQENKPKSAHHDALPGGALVVITDANGKFTFGIPKAGYWGFAALGSGPDTTYEGKELSQDAVLWIKAFELKE